MSSFDDFEEFLRLDPEERKQKVHDLLVEVSEPWLGDPGEDLVLGMVGSIRALMDAANQYADKFQEADEEAQANRYVMGLFMHTYVQATRNFATLSGLSDMKRSLDRKKRS